MKKILLTIFLFVSFCKTSFSQTDDWATYDLDAIVSIDMPFDVYEIDTIQDNQKLYEIYSSNDSISFNAKKSYVGVLYANNGLQLPHDYTSLKEFYSDIVWYYSEGLFNVERSRLIDNAKLKGLELILNDKEGTFIQKTHIYLVNEIVYLFTYENINGLNKPEEKTFFDSIIFNGNLELKQYVETGTSFYKKIILGLFLFLIVSFLLRFFSQKRNV